MPPWAHLALAAAWLVFGVVAFIVGWANVLGFTFALSVLALVETRLSAYEAACAKREAQTEETDR